MKKEYKRILSLLILFILFIGISNLRIKAEIDVNNQQIELVDDSKSAILMEASTGKIVYEKDANSRREPASMTKIMTMILVMDAIQKNIIQMDQTLTTSDKAEEMGGTQIYLETGEKMTVEDLLKAVAMASANDAAVVLGEAIGGSIEDFVKMMNDKASELGLTNTNFVNTNGLPALNHYSSCYDMAVMGRYLINNYGNIILKYTNTYEDYLRKGTEDEFWLVNTNKLVKLYPEVDGLKTGWTQNAGYCLTATMNKNGIRFIAVAMGASESSKRNADVMRMLNYGCATYEIYTIYQKGDIIQSVNDITTYPKEYDLVVSNTINYLKKRNEEKPSINTKIYIDRIKVYVNDSLYIEDNLIPSIEIRKASFIEMFIEVIKIIFLDS